jgi:DNA-binding CsgD family transcriptional regulator
MMDEGILKPKFLVDFQSVEFTELEKTVIRLIARELSTKEIADQMNKSERTIDGYRTDILEKTGARNSIGIVMYGIKAGIVIV